MNDQAYLKKLKAIEELKISLLKDIKKHINDLEVDEILGTIESAKFLTQQIMSKEPKEHDTLVGYR